jgi:hypothetical protein
MEEVVPGKGGSLINEPVKAWEAMRLEDVKLPHVHCPHYTSWIVI